MLVGGIPCSEVVTLRERVAKKIFLQLPKEERKGWGVQAKEEHEVAIENWQKEMQADPSTEPVARQKYVQSLYFYVS